ncbi:MAG: glycoside hydrolase family 99-like domain-containing protein [Bacteroidota bacterium]
MKPIKLRALAHYLPQFHPIPENDQWWGKGFTEWTNVTKCTPRFAGHYQPHLPTDMGFYDLRLEATRVAQAELAKAYGIHGFCYYHFWFDGKTLLEQPAEDLLASGKPDFPFCFCWANENWTRRWDGQDREVLMQQRYSETDDVRHIEYLLPFFQDKRYIKVDGKAVFLVYRTEEIPEIEQRAATWRKTAQQYGMELYLIRVESFQAGVRPESIGFDAALEFQPNWKKQLPIIRKNILVRALHKFGIKESVYSKNKIIEYADFVSLMLEKETIDYKRFPCITPMWDNSARREKGALIIRNSTPEFYQKWLEKIIGRFEAPSPEENFIFINAWNEWAEGNHLEPCRKYGRGYLEATKAAFSK